MATTLSQEQIKRHAERTLEIWKLYQDCADDPEQWQFAKARNRRLQAMNRYSKRHEIEDEVFERIRRRSQRHIDEAAAKRNREAAREIRNRYAATN